MQLIKTSDENLCAQTLADKISSLLSQNKKVLWLVPGGSNIKIAVATANILTKSPTENLIMALTDERYGPVGHKDSNWQQLIESGFPFDKIESFGILKNLPLQETVKEYGLIIEKLLLWKDQIIAQFGMGPDGHIGGVLPHTIGVTSTDITIGYEATPFTRISLSLETMKKINSAYMFVFGPTKKDAIMHLQEEGSLDDIPSRILKSLPEATVYTDQI